MIKFRVMLAAVLCTATSMSFAQQAAPGPAAAPDAAAPAAAATPAATPADQLQELDEVMVRGKRLLDQIADEEDDFYALFNKVNKDEKYDTSCVYLNLDPDSLTASIKSRVCIPGFVADAMADFQIWKMRCQPPYRGIDEFDCLDRNGDGRISWDEATARQELDSDFTTLDEDLDGKLSRDEFSSGNQTTGAPVVYQPPPPQLVLMEGTKDWYEHMMKVIREDPKLGEMAGKLDDLYRELAQVQTRFEELDPNSKAGVKPVSTKRTSGPREK
jgi:hypothetical protein